MRNAESHKPKLIRMENLRRVVQVLSFVAFVYLFVLTIGRFDYLAKQNVLTSKAPVDTFFRIDPLLGLGTMISTRQIIPVMLIYGLPIVILTILAGRFFCGWICPLGTALDATDTVLFRKRRVSGTSSRKTGRETSSRNTEPDTRSRNIKYYVLAAVVVAAVFSSQYAFLLDPITIITRAFTFAFYPVAQMTWRAFAAVPFIGDRLPSAAAKPFFFPQDVQYFFRLNFLAAIVFIGILAANAITRRFWCRNLCPLGALLGLLSKISIVRRVVQSNCISCKKCIPDCKMGAIKEDPTEYQAPECIYCYSCAPICPTLSTRIAPTIRSEGYNSELDLNRRRLFQAVGIGVLAAALGKTNAAAKSSKAGNVRISSDALIRPPGALPEDQFVDRCLRCSECMKVCPTNGLQPALTEAGLEGLWTPVLVPRVGECTKQCNLCSQVCSSQAIQPFDVKEKEHIYIGTAVIDRSQCIMWNFDPKRSNSRCMVCDECCSYHAVYWESVDGIVRPFVDKHKCVGCGICENNCPIQPTAAIRSFSFGDKRTWTREDQKRYFEQSSGRPAEG